MASERMKLTTKTKTTMNAETIGIDHTGRWSAAQYITDCGWSRESVEATARLGVSAEDASGLTLEQLSELHALCVERVTA